MTDSQYRHIMVIVAFEKIIIKRNELPGAVGQRLCGEGACVHQPIDHAGADARGVGARLLAQQRVDPQDGLAVG